mmetsp:Transcript_12279/g.47699  ORF Transcript_12279/g.47699 Transcript_12279/m.47699 type:complete len:278 (-) Transcript_12279:33-866(-)
MSAVVSRVPATVSAPLARLNKSGSAPTPIWVPVKRTDSTSTKPKVLLMVRPEVDPDAAVCVSEAAVSDIKMSSCIVATPATFNVLDKVAAPVTPSVPPAVRSPPTAVLPVPDATVNAVVATLKSPVEPRAPATATDALLSVMISVSPLMPMAFEVKRTDSTSTYPAVLVMARPPLDAVCVRAADVSDSFRSSETVRVPETATAPLERVMMSGSVLIPIWLSVNRTDSTSTYPLEVIARPVAPLCVRAARALLMVISLPRATAPVTPRVPATTVLPDE